MSQNVLAPLVENVTLPFKALFDTPTHGSLWDNFYLSQCSGGNRDSTYSDKDVPAHEEPLPHVR